MSSGVQCVPGERDDLFLQVLRGRRDCRHGVVRRDRPDRVGPVPRRGAVFNIAGIVLIPFAADRFGRRRTLVGTLLLTAVFSFAFYFVRQGGYSVLLLAQALISLSVGGVLPLLWAMSADTADYAERRSGRRDTGLIFSSYSMAQKMGWAVGSAATAWILSLAGFRSECRPVAGCAHGYRVSAKRLPGFGRFGDMCLHSVLSAGRFPAQIMIRYAQS